VTKSIYLGVTFVNVQVGSSPPSHLWMVLSDPTKGEKIVIANLSTFRKGFPNRNCLVKQGEHTFVSRDSIVYTAEACLTTIEHLDEAFRKKLLTRSTDVSAELLQKIHRCIDESSDVPEEVKEVLRRQGFIS